MSIDPGAGNVRGDEGDAARYRAPEVLGGDPPDPRSDVWSLGAVLLEALTGECLRGELEPRRSDLPDTFRDVLSRSLDPDPSRRFTNAGELLEALEDVG